MKKVLKKKTNRSSCQEQNDDFIFSNESYKKNTILDENFECIDSFFEEYDITLFDKKKKAVELFENKDKNIKFSIEDLLAYDNTNKKIQLEYLKLAVKILLKEKDSYKIEILIEKINKAGIICDEKDYNEAIADVSDKSSIKYKNYKNILKESFKKILENKNEKEIYDSFQFNKKYEFNQDCEIGENNYFFYCLIYQTVSLHLKTILANIDHYKPYIIKIIDFLETKNFSSLQENEKLYFEYLINKIFNENELTYPKQEMFDKYLESFEKYIKGLEQGSFSDESIENIREYFEDFNKSISKYKNIKYNFEINNQAINVNILDKSLITKNSKKLSKKYTYDINMFNNDILNMIKSNLNQNNFYNFESLFSACIKGGQENKFNEKYICKFKEIIKKILKSEAAEKYFDTYYKSKNKGLSYHFNKDSVIDEIFKRIKFCAIFEDGDQGYTSPFELKIYLNCIMGNYNKLEIHIFERSILQFARLIVTAIHEILGHFLRRYYSYLTNNLIKFGTKEDKYFKTGDEGGIFVQKKFLGLKNNSISLNESIGFFKSEFKAYPILYKDEIPENELIEIINNNKEYFDFISENMEEDKISIKELQEYLMKGFKVFTRFSCGSRRENAIYINNLYN